MRRPVALVVAATILALLACSGPVPGARESPTPTPRVRIGISLPTKTTARWITDSAGLVQPLTAMGYETDLQFAEDDPRAQASQVGEMVDEGVKVLVISPVDEVDLAEVLRRATSKGIKVLAYDRLIDHSPDVDAFVSIDNYRAGVIQAESIVRSLDLVDAAGPFNLELFGGNPDDPDSAITFAGSMSVLRPYIDSGRLVVQSGQLSFDQIAVARWDIATAQSRMEAVLKASYDRRRVDAILSPYDNISRGIIATLKGAGYYTAERPGPIVTGQDAELLSVRSILAGEQTSTVFRDSRPLAAQAVRMIDELATGKTVEVNDHTYDNGERRVSAFLLPPLGIDRSNVQTALVDSGYIDPLDLK